MFGHCVDTWPSWPEMHLLKGVNAVQWNFVMRLNDSTPRVDLAAALHVDVLECDALSMR